MTPRRLILAPLWVIRDLTLLVITYTPGPTGNWLRNWHYRRKLKSCGRNVTIDVGVLIEGPDLVSIGNNVHIDKYCIIATGSEISGTVHRKKNDSFGFREGELVIGDEVHIAQQCIIMAYGGVSIGDRCGFSAGAKLYSLTNIAYDPADRSKIVSVPFPLDQAHSLAAPVVLEENVWLGLNVLVMPGVTIGRDTFATSNSLLVSSCPANSYLEGQPAKRTRSRFRDLGK